jgi:hypothetical protein
MTAAAQKAYDYRRGAIEVLDRGRGDMRCSHCGATWQANIKGGTGGKYYPGSWTCHSCGANTKSKHQGS